MEEKILLALAPIICTVATTIASTTDSSTAYSAMSCPSSRASLSNGRSHKLIPPNLGASGEGCLENLFRLYEIVPIIFASFAKMARVFQKQNRQGSKLKSRIPYLFFRKTSRPGYRVRLTDPCSAMSSEESPTRIPNSPGSTFQLLLPTS